mmetsp:Transcript_22575/g.21752  ORF Transcript_22575/g.21752 Transcript_22575/m.21752 type:complete len:103 (+) Transcript_22575:193-501(+)
MQVFNSSSYDGATALHRAAEIGSIEIGKILLEHNADIDALNFSGHTSFHIAGQRKQYEFGKFLIKNRAKKLCRQRCAVCKLFIKQIDEYEKSLREQEEQKRQ